MNVLHISTYGGGGAGIAAFRLHNALLTQGVNSRFLCSRYPPNGKEVYTFPEKRLTPFQYILHKTGIKKSHLSKNLDLKKYLSTECEFISYPFTNYNLHEHPLVKEADIIHLHWVSNFLDYRFFKHIKKPVVWTLHDMNPFQGAFHYYNDLLNNQSTFGDKEKELTRIKAENLHQCSKLEVVTLSNWMKECSQKSMAFRNRKHHLIRNSIHTDKFKIYNRDFAREVFNLPKDKIIFLFVSDTIDFKRKGLDILIEALSEFSFSSRVCLAVLGNEKLKVKGSFETVNLGYISDERALGLMYAAADAYLLPSREDNLPNVMLEALSCGTPVISTPVGGMLDIIRNGFNGILSEELSGKSMKEALEKFLIEKDNFNREAIREFAIKKFSPSLQAEKYMSVYNSLLNDQ